MKASTKTIHDKLSTIGLQLGFAVEREVGDSLLRLRWDAGYAYRPRIDLMWSLPLDAKKRKALALALGRDISGISHFPVVGIEVEGSQPSTRTMASDVANLAALGAPLGLLVVSEIGEPNIYRRATRVVRSIRRSFGDLHVVPMEAAWLDRLSLREWTAGPSVTSMARPKAPAGGEGSWSKRTRELLRNVGRVAGFTVVEPFRPSVLGVTYEWIRDQRKQVLTHTIDPTTGVAKPMTRAGDYLTECEIDLAWLMPLPLALHEFLVEVVSLDPCLREHGLCFPELWNCCAVAAFEIDTSTGKHAAGGLLNLAAFGAVGIVVTPDSASCTELTKTLMTYQPTLGLRNVFVRALPDVESHGA